MRETLNPIEQAQKDIDTLNKAEQKCLSLLRKGETQPLTEREKSYLWNTAKLLDKLTLVTDTMNMLLSTIEMHNAMHETLDRGFFR